VPTHKKARGPKTAAGRLKSSRNALRHGLSCPLPLDPAMSAKVEAIAQALTGEGASQDQVTSAAEFAQAQLELLRIRASSSEAPKICGVCWHWTATCSLATSSGSPRTGQSARSANIIPFF
jgi:hypothetical protein